MPYLLDTNIISEAVAARPNAGVMRELARHRGDSVTAAPVWHELLYGCLRLPASSRRDRLLHYLEDVVAVGLDILPYDGPVAARHAAERARLQGLGLTVPFVDGQIAATALVHGLVLATRNARDFESFEGLRVENWFDS